MNDPKSLPSYVQFLICVESYSVDVWYIYYDMLRIFSTFPPLSFYSNIWYYSYKLLNTNILSDTIFCFYYKLILTISYTILLIFYSYFVVLTCYTRLVHICYRLEVHTTRANVIINITNSPFYNYPLLPP